MESRWTKGPWKMQEYENGKISILHSVKEDSSFVIADMAKGHHTRANARLIAAAPEIAQYLKDMACGRFHGGGEWEDEMRNAELAAYNILASICGET